MAAEIIIAPEAEQDLAEAYAWYEARRIGLGEEFVTAVDACFEHIRRTPEGYGTVHETYRRALTRRFPYASSMSTFRVLSPCTQYSMRPVIRGNSDNVCLEQSHSCE